MNIESGYNPIEQKSEQEKHLEAVERTVTLIWEHPLVDDSLRNFRDNMKIRGESFLRELGVNKDDCILIPVGSIYWGVDEFSDLDVIAVASNSETVQEINRRKRSIMSGIDEGRKLSSGVHDRDIDLIEVVNIEDPREYMNLRSMELLFTPDTYIVGSPDLIAQYRLEMVRQIENHSYLDTDEFWDVVIERFTMLHQNWKELESKDDMLERLQGIDMKKRRDRFNKLLDRRALQAKMPKGQYKEEFLQALERFSIPDFETYKSALELSGGHIHVRERFKAEQIKD